MTCYYLFREDPNEEAIGLFDWPHPLRGADNVHPYFLNPDDDGGMDKSFWVEEISKAEYDTYKHFASIPVKDIQQIKMAGGNGGDITLNGGNAGGTGTGGDITLNGGNGISANFIVNPGCGGNT